MSEYRQVRVKDLPDLTGNNIWPQPMLVCDCGEWSANKGDYFQLKDNYVMHCSRCDEDMVLMTKRVVYEQWEPKKTTSEPKEPKDLHKGDRVHVSHISGELQASLTYPSFSGVLLEDVLFGTSEGWDVVDVRADSIDTPADVAGKVVSVYCFSIVRE